MAKIEGLQAHLVCAASTTDSLALFRLLKYMTWHYATGDTLIMVSPTVLPGPASSMLSTTIKSLVDASSPARVFLVVG